MPPMPEPKATPEPMLARLAKALGLPEGATEDDALAARPIERARLVETLAKGAGKAPDKAAALASEATPDPARFVPVETVRAMLAERNAAVATMSEERATAKVEAALRKGHLSPAMKTWAVALCRSDEAAFDAFVSTVPPAFAHLSDRAATAHPRGPVQSTIPVDTADAVSMVASQLGLKPEALLK
jgi:phage I-like protein